MQLHPLQPLFGTCKNNHQRFTSNQNQLNYIVTSSDLLIWKLTSQLLNTFPISQKSVGQPPRWQFNILTLGCSIPQMYTVVGLTQECNSTNFRRIWRALSNSVRIQTPQRTYRCITVVPTAYKGVIPLPLPSPSMAVTNCHRSISPQ